MIENIIKFLNNGWVGSVLGIGGILLAIWFYHKAKQSPKISVHFDAQRMIGWGNSDVLPKNLTVNYKGLPVDRLSRVIIRIWNSGNDTLESSLIPKSEPFRIELESQNSAILSGLVLLEPNPTNKFSVKIDPEIKNKLIINFDYISPNEGVVIGIMHTDINTMPIFKGIIKGHKVNILRDYKNVVFNQIKKYFYPNIIEILGKGLFISGAAIILGILITPDNVINTYMNLSKNQANLKELFEVKQFFIILGFTYLTIGYLLLWSKKSRYPKHLTYITADTLRPRD